MVTIERIEATLIKVAALMERDPAFTPVFERFESELDAARQTSTKATKAQSWAALILHSAKARSKPTGAKLSGQDISGGGKPGLRFEDSYTFLCASLNRSAVIQCKPDQNLATMTRDKLRTLPKPPAVALLALNVDARFHRIAKSLGRYDRVVNEAAYNGCVG